MQQSPTHNSGRHRNRSLWDRTWKDSRGKVAIWQTPNGWLISWAALTTLSLFVNGRTADILSWIGSAALIVWALLEIFKGDSYFRRALGILVLIFAVTSLIKAL